MSGQGGRRGGGGGGRGRGRRDDYGGGGYHGGGGRGGGGYHGGGGRGGGGYYGGGGGRGGGGYQGGGGGRGGGGYQGGGGRGGGGYRGGGGGYRGGGRDGGRGGRGGGRGRGNPEDRNLKQVLTNIIPATVTENFQFYIYAIDVKDRNGNPVDSRSRRMQLFNEGFWDGLLKDMPEKEKKDWKRIIFFAGSFFYSIRRVPGLEKEILPKVLVTSSSDAETMTCVDVLPYKAPTQLTDGMTTSKPSSTEVAFDQYRVEGSTKTFPTVEAMLQHCRDTGHTPIYPDTGPNLVAAPHEVFISFVNMALQRALGERLAKWGREFVDPKAPIQKVDRRGNDLKISLYEAYSASFGLIRGQDGKATLALTCDLRAKVIRNQSVLDAIYEGKGQTLSESDKKRARSQWVGQTVIYRQDKKCYTVTDLDFDHSPDTLPVPTKNTSHTAYFKQKGINLEHPHRTPMIKAMNRRNQHIFLPAELVTGDELDSKVRESLPQIASFKPDKRNEAIEKIKKYLTPGQHAGQGDLLPAIGVMLKSERLPASAKVLPAPSMIAAGISIPKEKSENWGPVLGRANFNIDPKQATTLNVIVFHHKYVSRGAQGVYNTIRDMVNGFKSRYRFAQNPELVMVEDNDRHWGGVERRMSSNVPDNLFVLDFAKPRQALDPAYPVVKHILCKAGHLSQFVNFKTFPHDEPYDDRKSNMILQGCARQILQKCGVRIWWVDIPPSLPLPAVFVGIDVFHAPTRYDPVKKERVRKASVAAIIVEVVRGSGGQQKIELYTETLNREGGQEHELGDALKNTMQKAMKLLRVEPACAVVWRDGISESAFSEAANDEIRGVRAGLNESIVGQEKKAEVPITYIVCQKRIATKLLTPDGQRGAPSGTLVGSVQGLEHQTFYINGRAPPFSTPKPVRFIVVQRDKALKDLPVAELTWSRCHDYPNWAGPVKVPAVCQMAHKLAELAGGFSDAGATIASERYLNKVHFL